MILKFLLHPVFSFNFFTSDLETVNIQDCHSVIDNNNNIEENFKESALFFDSTYSYKGREPSTGLETMNMQVCHICDRNVSDLKKHLSSFHHFRTSTLEVFDKNGNNGKNTYQTSPIGNATNSYESPEHSSGPHILNSKKKMEIDIETGLLFQNSSV
ncbi:hypothetical protein WA026_019338 [Henosepilachna vigintioctopunctata]|uniref:C2H2-type domain-containing protein n=1 Tax=Henosepilachna vigintioctopunctata TaxID=420089 RepID=A0AAW1UBY9_9CUCU